MDRSSRAVYVIPLESDEYRIPPDGRLQVFRSRNGGVGPKILFEGARDGDDGFLRTAHSPRVLEFHFIRQATVARQRADNKQKTKPCQGVFMFRQLMAAIFC